MTKSKNIFTSVFYLDSALKIYKRRIKDLFIFFYRNYITELLVTMVSKHYENKSTKFFSVKVELNHSEGFKYF